MPLEGSDSRTVNNTTETGADRQGRVDNTNTADETESHDVFRASNTMPKHLHDEGETFLHTSHGELDIYTLKIFNKESVEYEQTQGVFLVRR